MEAAPKVEVLAKGDKLAEALRALSGRKEEVKSVRRVCDVLLVRWLAASSEQVVAAWAPLSLHGVSAPQIRQMGGDTPAPKPKRQKTAALPPLPTPVKTARVVEQLGMQQKPKGQAPTNDQGERLVWSYKRGIWLDTDAEPGGTCEGKPSTPSETAAIAAEIADLDQRINALNAGCDVEYIKTATLPQVKEAIATAREKARVDAQAAAAAEAKAEAAAAAEAEAKRPPPQEVLKRALPKLVSRLKLEVADSAWFADFIKRSAEAGVPMAIHAKERKSERKVPVSTPGECDACAGKHRPHTCGKGKSSSSHEQGSVVTGVVASVTGVSSAPHPSRVLPPLPASASLPLQRPSAAAPTPAPARAPAPPPDAPPPAAQAAAAAAAVAAAVQAVTTGKGPLQPRQ